MCAWYVVFKRKQPGVYTSWAKCSEHVLGYRGAMHKKYNSYEEAMTIFNSTINSISTSKLCSFVTEPGSTPFAISYKQYGDFFLCALVCAM
jgi:ribonuclease HI